MCIVFIFRASHGLVIVATRVVTSLYQLEETSVRFLSTCLPKLYKHYSYLSSINDEKKKKKKKRQWSLISLPIIDTLEAGEGR